MTDDEIIEWAVANGIEFHPVKQQVRVGVHALAGTDSMPALRRLCAMAAAKERAARQAAQIEVAELKGRIARAGVEQRRAVSEAVREAVQAAPVVASAEQSRELLECVGCGHLYEVPGISACCCGNNPRNEYSEWVAVPSFTHTAKRKLDEQLAKGWRITGYAIEQESDGQTMRGFIAHGGFVGWWRPMMSEEGYLSKDKIRSILLANGYTIKDGESDLKTYVYAAAKALLDAAPGRPTK